ncbi:recombinase family protein [Streptomyces thinghirensis]|uniref:recombinase family protein n=1 Tax=Streptomyces thinghirensis TaxID=551547 RepID=UPI003CD054A4
MALAFCRVSTIAQDLDRELDAVRDAGVAEEHIYVGKRSGAKMDREGLTALLGLARPGDRINVLTLDGARPQHARDPQPRPRPHRARRLPAHPRATNSP